MPTLETMTLEVTGRVARIMFTRPDALNSLTERAFDDLEAAIDAAEADPGVRVLVIGGTGRAFSVGLDLALLDEAFADPAVWERIAKRLAALTLRLERLPMPVIASVNGLARAGGFEVLLACDLVLIADSARIADAHAEFGVIPAGGSTARLPRIVGRQRAREIFLTGRWIPAAEAVELGIALKAVPAGELDAAVDGLAATLAGRPRACMAAMKRQFAAVEGLPLAEAVVPEIEEFVSYVTPADSDGQEGFRAYRENRPPTWA
ncbi:enoyl-CoA hydratase/isomerase family protein [Actinomadura bangladeshensis]|uniref:Enoyl-CoA hydratase/isomerase family protein n=1 Tax=Actinomadura bangladeshensis TaxID=453573 RepID=A0A4R4PBB1_9ACTN|nr:enoyl-CoA hydratase/isomerase family protein [Actinomadura bangladeshensis]TDC17632.1 enoyl-CoA hydratase/isomerase family protein [Actinomadura bangladeshensis]